MPLVNLGRVGFVFKGQHTTAVAYKVQDVVTDGNSLYSCIQAHDNVIPHLLTDPLYWAIMIDGLAPLTLTDKTIDSITNNVGADHIHYKVRNASGTTIPINTVVTASGTQPGTDYIQVIPVTDPQTQIALGLVHTALLNNDVGLVVNTGVHDDMNTSAWTVGTILYPNTSGGFTSTKPTAGRYQACAIVLRQHASSGTMLVEFTEPTTLSVQIDSTTGAAYLPVGTTAQRPVAPTDGFMRYNTDLISVEVYSNGAWGSVGGGATGGGTDHVFVNTEYTINSSYTIPAGKSSVIVSDSSNNVYFAAGVQIDFSTGSKVVVL